MLSRLDSSFLSDDSDLYVQDNIQPTTYYYSRDIDDLGTGNDYFFEYSQLNPDGNQVQISFSHARRYHQPSSSSQAGQHNQPKFHTRGPNYLYPPYFTEYPRFVSIFFRILNSMTETGVVTDLATFLAGITPELHLKLLTCRDRRLRAPRSGKFRKCFPQFSSQID